MFEKDTAAKQKAYPFMMRFLKIQLALSPFLLMLGTLFLPSFSLAEVEDFPEREKLPCLIFFYGPPESGKDSFSPMIQEEFNIPSIHPGAAFLRKILMDFESNEYEDEADVLRSDYMYQLLLQYLAHEKFPNGLLIENFEFTNDQLKEIYTTVAQKFRCFALSIKTDEQFLLEKTGSRLYCMFCGTIYDTRIKKINTCETCNQKLLTRHADRPEIVRNRYAEYIQRYSKALDFFREKNALTEIPAIPNFVENENVIRCFIQVKTHISPKKTNSNKNIFFSR